MVVELQQPHHFNEACYQVTAAQKYLNKEDFEGDLAAAIARAATMACNRCSAADEAAALQRKKWAASDDLQQQKGSVTSSNMQLQLLGSNGLQPCSRTTSSQSRDVQVYCTIEEPADQSMPTHPAYSGSMLATPHQCWCGGSILPPGRCKPTTTVSICWCTAVNCAAGRHVNAHSFSWKHACCTWQPRRAL